MISHQQPPAQGVTISDELRVAWLEGCLKNWIAAAEGRAVNTQGELGRGLVKALDLSIQAWEGQPLPEGLAALARKAIPTFPVVFSSSKEPSQDDLRLFRVSEWFSKRCNAWLRSNKGKAVPAGPSSAAVGMLEIAVSRGSPSIVRGLLQDPESPPDACSRFYWKPPHRTPGEWSKVANIDEKSSRVKVSLGGVATVLGVQGFKSPQVQQTCDHVLSLSDPLAPISKDGPALLGVCMHSGHLESLLPRAMASGRDMDKIKACVLSSASAIVSPGGMAHWFSSLKNAAPELARELALPILLPRLSLAYLPSLVGDYQSEIMVKGWRAMMDQGGIDFLTTQVGDDDEPVAALLAKGVGLSQSLGKKSESGSELSPTIAWEGLAGPGTTSPGGQVGALWALWAAQYKATPQVMTGLVGQVLSREAKDNSCNDDLAHFFQDPGLAKEVAALCRQMPCQAMHGLASLLSEDTGRKWSNEESVLMLDSWARGVLSMDRIEEFDDLNVFTEKAFGLAKKRMSMRGSGVPSDWTLVFSLVGLDSSPLEEPGENSTELRQGIEKWREFDRLPSGVWALLDEAWMKCSLPGAPAGRKTSRPGRL